MQAMKPISEQVLVITGASSGIGLATARLAAEAGARVVLASRNPVDLENAVSAIRATGGRATHQVADVSQQAEVELIAARAMREFGAVDTWVNNAGVSLYGRIMDVDLDDMRRLFDVNFWGMVHGARVAVPLLARDGGTIINVASALADRAIPLQGTYCAAKHAMKAFTDSLRMELEEAGLPVAVSLVKPSSMNTPLFEKARTVHDVEPQPVPPVYAPEVTAKVILECAEKPTREVMIGGMGKVLSIAQKLSPRLTDRYMERSTFDSQMSPIPIAGDRDDNLYAPVARDGGERGGTWFGHTRGSSLYTQAEMHPARAGAAVAVAGLGLAAILAYRTIQRRNGRNGDGNGHRR